MELPKLVFSDKMNIPKFIKELPIERIHFNEDFLLMELSKPLKIIVECEDNMIIPLICDGMDYNKSANIMFFGCNNHYLLEKRVSEICNLQMKECPQEEYENECKRIQEVFV